MIWKDKIVLNNDEDLKHESSRTEGFMSETDIDVYSVFRKDGTKVGTITVRDHTAVKGFKRTVSVVQTDSSGKVLVDESL